MPMIDRIVTLREDGKRAAVYYSRFHICPKLTSARDHGKTAVVAYALLRMQMKLPAFDPDDYCKSDWALMTWQRDLAAHCGRDAACLKPASVRASNGEIILLVALP